MYSIFDFCTWQLLSRLKILGNTCVKRSAGLNKEQCGTDFKIELRIDSISLFVLAQMISKQSDIFG